MDDVLYGSDEVERVLEPVVGVVDDAAVFVLRDFVAVNEPLQRSEVPFCIGFLKYITKGEKTQIRPDRLRCGHCCVKN